MDVDVRRLYVDCPQFHDEVNVGVDVVVHVDVHVGSRLPNDLQSREADGHAHVHHAHANHRTQHPNGYHAFSHCDHDCAQRI